MLLLSLLLAQCPPPTGTLTITPEAGATDLNGVRKPLVVWNIVCPAQGGACPNVPAVTLSGLRTEFAAQPSEAYAQGTGFAGASGTGPLPGFGDAVGGGNFQFSALVDCNNPGSFVRLTSPAVVFKPVLVSSSFFVSERDANDGIIGIFDATGIPVGKRVELRPAFEVALAPNEAAQVRVEGAGVSWSKSYSFPTRPSANAVTLAVRDDPTARFVFSTPGPVAFSVSVAGVKSTDAVFTVVSANTGGGGGGSNASGGGGAGTAGGGGGGGASQGGCSAVAWPWPLLTLALGLARRSRRTRG